MPMRSGHEICADTGCEMESICAKTRRETSGASSKPSLRIGGALFLGDNGNLSVAWQDGEETRLETEFLGSGKVQYLIFKKLEGDSKASGIVGQDTFDRLKLQIDAFGLRPLLADGR